MSYATLQAETFPGQSGRRPLPDSRTSAEPRPLLRLARSARAAGRLRAARVRRAAWCAVRGTRAPSQ